MRRQISAETWEQIKTAFASRIRLREIARNTRAYDFGTLRFHWRIASFPPRFRVYRGTCAFRFPLVSYLVSSRFPFRTLYQGNGKRSLISDLRFASTAFPDPLEMRAECRLRRKESVMWRWGSLAALFRSVTHYRRRTPSSVRTLSLSGNVDPSTISTLPLRIKMEVCPRRPTLRLLVTVQVPFLGL